MTSSRGGSSAVILTWLCGLMMLSTQGCQAAPQTVLDPATIRASTAAAAEQQVALQRWQLAIDLANEFLGSSFNRTLPRETRLRLDDDGMRLQTADRTMPIKLVLIDDYRTSSCVCATVDTYKDVVYVYRPWGADLELPIATCNTFFTTSHGHSEPAVNLATHVLRTATILFYEKHAHISTWEWFKCQWLEGLIGSGHHEYSMQRPGAVTTEVSYFWRGMDPATPAIKRILSTKPDAAAKLAERSRQSAACRETFEEYIRERTAEQGDQVGSGSSSR